MPDPPRLHATALRASIALSIAAVAGICAFTAAVGITGSSPAGILLAAVAAGIVGLALWRRPVVDLDEGAAPRALAVVSGLATLLALVQLARLAVFMVAPSQAGYSTVPSIDWEVRHSCLSAYFVAAQAAGEVPNVYDDALYSLPSDPGRTRRPRRIGHFSVDAYEYPPPFLLLPRALLVLAPDFLRLRMLWFALNAGVVLLAMLVVARSLGPAKGTRALLLVPLVWAAMPFLNTLQKGNIQVVIIALAMIAMALFERRRFAAGGTLLAYAFVSKLYPGMLIVYLLARRQWRAIGWTTALSVILVVLTLLDMGWAPFAAFVHHLPGLLGGEAFPAFRNPAATAINYSIPGVVFKLKLFGVPGMGFGAAKVVGWVYTLVVLWVTVVVARRTRREGETPSVWLAILILATLRSPFLPQAYAPFPSLWLLTLLAASSVPNRKTLLLTLLGWLALNVYLPVDGGFGPRGLAVLSSLPQAATIAVAVIALRIRREPRPTTA